MLDLATEEAIVVYGRRLGHLCRLRRDHGRELNADGIRLLNRCERETRALLRGLQVDALA